MKSVKGPEKFFQWLFFVMMVVCSVTASQATGTGASTPLPANFSSLSGPQAVVPMPTTLISGRVDQVDMQFSQPSLELNTVTVDQAVYSTIQLTGEGSTVDAGSPDLPRVTRLIMINPTGQVNLAITSESYHTEQLAYPPAPRRELAGDEQASAPRNEQIYTTNAFYPAEIAGISEPMTLRDVRFVVLTINPVQVNPVTGEMRVYDNIAVRVENAGGTGINELTHTPTSITPGFKKLYSAFENFHGSALDALPVVPGKQLIICGDSSLVIAQVQKLVDWRRKKGIDAGYVTINTIGGNSTDQIRNYISNLYTSSNGELEFVTIIGDPDATAPYNIVSNGGQLDNYYGNMGDGPNPDPVPDIAVGRLPVRSNSELNALVTRIIQYESNPYMSDPSWFTRSWCVAHTSMVASNPSTKQYTRQIMLQHGMQTVDFNVLPGHTDVTLLNTRVNAGISILNDRMSWIGEFYSSDLGGLANGWMLPFVMVITCGTGSFNGSDALSEDWVRLGSSANPAGAIGCVGLSGTGTHVPYNNIVDAGVMYGYFVQDIQEQGIAVIAGKLQLFKNYYAYGHSGDVQNFSYWANLMGDPAVPVWRYQPQTATVTRPAQLIKHTNNVAFRVLQGGQPVEDALVGLVKGTETFARGYTDASGNLNLPVTLPTTGYLTYVVTRKDLITVRDSIPVIDAAAALTLSSTGVDDDNTNGTIGNSDQILNPGETIDLNLRIQNTGTASTATGISATLTASLPGITIVSGTRSYPDITVGNTAFPTSPFRIQVGAVYNAEPIAFYLNFTSSAGPQTIRFDLTPAAANVSYTGLSFPDANSRLDPGESGIFTVTITNSGVRPLVNAQGILRSLDPHVTVSDSLGSFGTIAASGTGTNTGNPFTVAADLATVGGYRAPMQLVITDDNGFRDSTDLVDASGVIALEIGTVSTTTATGPDAYGYYAFDNTETQPVGTATPYIWAEIAGGPGTRLGLDDGSEDGDMSTVVTLPFSFRFYGQTFSQITVCTNGWLAFGSQTNTDFRNYRMGSAIGPINMVAAYWDDLVTTGITNGGVYVWNDAGAHRYIVEWRTRTLWSGEDEVFEVILFDPAYYPSGTGDGKVMVSYHTMTISQNGGSNDNDFATIGIQNADHSIGLEYGYWNTWAATAAPVQDGRSIMYTTDMTGYVRTPLALISPTVGGLWPIDSTVAVSWQGGEQNATIRIELSRHDLIGPWEILAAGAANIGSYAVAVTGPASSTCRVRITSNSDVNDTDTSDSLFVIGRYQMLLSEGFESGAPTWSHASAGGTWVDNWHYSTERAYAGTHSAKCGDTGTGEYSNLNDARLISPVIANLPAEASLYYFQEIATEISGSYPDSAYDGGVIEVSVNGGEFTEIPPVGNYPKTLRYWANNNGTRMASGPMPGRPAFGGIDTLAWRPVQVNLAAYEGQSIQLRWRFGSDSSSVREGWYLDDVRVLALAPIIAEPVVPTAVTIAIVGTDLVLRWADDGNAHYRVYSATNISGPYDTLEGTSDTNQLTIPNGASSARKYFHVTGWDGN
jgi:hypothetical protein